MNRTTFFMFFMSITCAFGFLHKPSVQAKPVKLCPVVTLEGSWKKIGYDTAYYFRHTIGKGAKQFRNLGVKPRRAQEYYDEVERFIHDDIKEQILGMRNGLSAVGLTMNPPKKELIWNFSMDIMKSWNLGCTAFAFNSKRGTFLAHNTDNVGVTIDMNTVIHFKPDNGDNSFLSFFSPGFVGVGMGINEKKLALSFNVGEPNNNAQPGLPVVFKAREVMAKCDNLQCAIDTFSRFLDREEANYGELGAILTVVDFKDSTMARIQICSDGMSVTYGHELHTEDVTYSAVANHFEGRCALQKPGRFRPLAWFLGIFRGNRKDSSHHRYERLMEMLTTEGISYDMETCWWILTDYREKSSPTNNTICRRGFPVSTTASHVLTERFCYYSLGLPSKYLARYGKPLFIDLDDGLSRAVKPSITGTVKKSRDDEIPSIPIDLILLPASDDKLPFSPKYDKLTTYTSPKGKFVFNNLVAGEYLVRVGKQHPGVDVKYDGENVEELEFYINHK
jgi:hypothetical protein